MIAQNTLEQVRLRSQILSTALASTGSQENKDYSAINKHLTRALVTLGRTTGDVETIKKLHSLRLPQVALAITGNPHTPAETIEDCGELVGNSPGYAALVGANPQSDPATLQKTFLATNIEGKVALIRGAVTARPDESLKLFEFTMSYATHPSVKDQDAEALALALTSGAGQLSTPRIISLLDRFGEAEGLETQVAKYYSGRAPIAALLATSDNEEVLAAIASRVPQIDILTRLTSHPSEAVRVQALRNKLLPFMAIKKMVKDPSVKVASLASLIAMKRKPRA